MSPRDRKPPQKGVYPRTDSRFLWMNYRDASGRRVTLSSKTTDPAVAKKRLDAIRRKVAAEIRAGVGETGPLTVERYAKRWIAERRERGVASVDTDEGRLEHHAFPRIGRLLLDEVRHVHLRDFVRELAVGGRHAVKRIGTKDDRLSTRSVLHVYGVLRVMFNDAVAEGLILASPCTLRVRRNELPKKRDKDPLWRHTAVYARAEVEQLISDLRIPFWRRVYYGLLFLAGLRAGEAVIRRWRDYDDRAEPLGQLLVATAYDRAGKREKSTKTGVVRQVPVHRTLAAILASWRLGGWEASQGRAPTPDDFIIANPEFANQWRSRKGVHLRIGTMLAWLHRDLETLGMRRRRQHDTRRTFISLALADRASKDILEWVTHGAPGDIIGEYTTLPWETLCGEVSKLNVSLRKGQLHQIQPATALLRGPVSHEKDS